MHRHAAKERCSRRSTAAIFQQVEPSEGGVSIAVALEPSSGSPPAVEYRWDADTDILTARIQSSDGGAGPSGSVELEGPDGAWLILDVVHGRIAGVEVAVWPEVHKRAVLAPPTSTDDARAMVPLAGAEAGPALVEMETPLHAESDEAERVIHFRVGTRRDVRAVRLGRDLLLELDAQSRIAGLWLLNVPPLPPT
jgi:hypothetical protein